MIAQCAAASTQTAPTVNLGNQRGRRVGVMNASEEAVEAAAKAIFLHRSRSNGPDLGRVWDSEMSDDLKSIFRLEAREVIKAVAPHLMVGVPNPYKSAPIYPLGKIEDKRP